MLYTVRFIKLNVCLDTKLSRDKDTCFLRVLSLIELRSRDGSWAECTIEHSMSCRFSASVWDGTVAYSTIVIVLHSSPGQ